MIFLPNKNQLALKDRLFAILHYGLRVLPGVGAFLLVVVLDLPSIAYGLIVLSKWRIFTARLPVLWTNLQLNMVDLMVGLALVYFMAWPEVSLWLQVFWLVLYLGWVLWLKSQSNKYGHLTQALLAQAFAGTIIIYNLYRLGTPVALTLIWVVAFLAARHIFNGFEAKRYHGSLVYIWSLFSVQLAWVLFHWQTYLWFIPQYVFLQTIILTTAVSLYILHYNDKLSAFFRKQIIASVLLVVVVTLLAANLHRINW